MARYSDLALDREITFCFLFFQLTKFSRTKTQYPEVDLWSMVHPAQSASVYTYIDKLLLDKYRMPFPGSLFKYLTR
jgi:hypothetical protein